MKALISLLCLAVIAALVLMATKPTDQECYISLRAGDDGVI